MSTNNFKRLMEMEEARYSQPPPRVSRNIQHTTGFYSFAANIFEIFLPKVVDIFVVMSGGKEEEEEKRNNGRYAPNRGGRSRNRW